MTRCTKCGISMPTNVKFCRQCRPEFLISSGEFFNMDEKYYRVSSLEKLDAVFHIYREFLKKELGK